jgi:hypothetical protein
MQLTVRWSATLTLLSLASCTTGNDRAARQPKIDTLPGGIIRTISKSPVDSGRWHLVFERTVQPAEGTPGELIDPSDLALAEDGTLYVVDDKPMGIKVFGPDGRYLRSIGRAGDGPGEFRYAYLALKADTLVVHDPRLGRSSTFVASTGAFLNVKSTAGMYFAPIGLDGEGRVVVPQMVRAPINQPMVIGYVRFALNGSGVDTVVIPQRPTTADPKRWIVPNPHGPGAIMDHQVPLRPRDLVAVDRTGGFVTGWSGEYFLRTTRNGTDTGAIFGRSFKPEAVTATEKQQLIDAAIQSTIAGIGEIPEATLRQAFTADAIPDQRPAFEGLWTDPAGRRWVRLSEPDTTLVRFDLFDARGRWVDQLTVPRNKWTPQPWQPVAWSADRVAIVRPDEREKPMIAVYRITNGSTP